MKNAHPDCPSLDCPRAANEESSDAHNKPGTGWRFALAALVSAPVRLHRFRNLPRGSVRRCDPGL